MVVILCWKGSKQIWKQRPTGVAVLEAECVTFRVKRGGVEPVVLGVGWYLLRAPWPWLSL